MKRLILLLFLINGIVPQIYTNGAINEGFASEQLVYMCYRESISFNERM